MNLLQKACKNAVKDCLKITKKDSVLIITDKNKLEIANCLLQQSLKLTKNSKLIKIPVAKLDGQEPPKRIAKEMLKYSVIIAPTTKSITHTEARINVCKKGSRVATLPGITQDIMKRTMNADYKKINKLTLKLAKKLKNSKEILVKTKKGTNIKLIVKNKQWIPNIGLIDGTTRTFGNLPAGEIFIAPMEGKSSGTFIVDASMAGIGKLKNPIKITVKNGFAIKIQGKQEAKKLRLILKKKAPLSFNIAEFGIGTNYKAKITGNILEDEKVLGTCHIALGTSFGFGGKIKAGIHLDGIIKDPTIYADKKLIIKKRKIF